MERPSKKLLVDDKKSGKESSEYKWDVIRTQVEHKDSCNHIHSASK